MSELGLVLLSVAIEYYSAALQKRIDVSVPAR